MNDQFNEIFRHLETWYASDRGGYLLARLQAELDRRLETAFGYHILQVGPVQCPPLFGECRIHHRIYASNRPGEGVGLVCDGEELPLESDSVDVIIAHHALEFADNPHQVLRELQRVLTPQGQLLLTGWNPRSLRGLSTRLRGMSRSSLWHSHRPVSVGRLTDWLNLLGCDIEDSSYLYTLPPVGSAGARDFLARSDQWCTSHGLPTGGLYLVRAVKQVAAHTRLRLAKRRAEKLIGLAVPKGGAAPAPTPGLPSVRPASGAARKGPVLH